jgi:HlyD family secretion protein
LARLALSFALRQRLSHLTGRITIVPHGDDLIVKAKVAPSDVDQIGPGASTVVRINAGNQRTMPELNGILFHVSADLTRDQPSAAGPGQAYYLVRVSLPKAELERLEQFRLLSGMPAGNLHPDLCAHAAAISAQAAARADRTHLSRAVD